ncbi:MAG: hypothetical protein HY721_07910 [Planctomycetes bacterium]|nr:hypothetical protein [Planctomycetota bacterium]
MSKCPRCTSRKGKRRCPALKGAEICPRCCAEERLKTIQCPESCVYLRPGEYYQLQRRRERAFSRGREFIEWSKKLSARRPVVDFLYDFQADVFFFCREQGPVRDAPLADALEDLASSLSKIYVPRPGVHPVRQFLSTRLQDAKRYPERPDLGAEDRVKALRTLAGAIRSLGDTKQGGAQARRPPGDGTCRYWEVLVSFFGNLDFEADLQYSPYDSMEPQEPQERQEPTERRSAGGLILPP